jgi:hypothetical protein
MDRSEDQIEFLDKIEDKQPKCKLRCKYHRYNIDTDFIDIKTRSGRIVKRCMYCERVRQDNKKIFHQEWLHEKENLTDYYIRRTFVVGKGPKLKMNEYPDIMVDAKRAVLKLKRHADKEKEPVKKCASHGSLYMEDVIKSGKTKAGTQLYKCRQCMSDFHAAHYALHKANVRLKQQHYRKANPERVRATRRKSRIKCNPSPTRLYNMQLRIEALERLARRSNKHKESQSDEQAND